MRCRLFCSVDWLAFLGSVVIIGPNRGQRARVSKKLFALI